MKDNKNPTKTYNTRKQIQQNPFYFNSSFKTYENYDDNFEDPFEVKDPSTITKYPLSFVKDLNISVQKKKYSKPYISSDFGGWEIDFMIVPFSSEGSSIFTHFKINKINADQGNSNFYYLFAININTKYLYVFPSFAKDTRTVIESISKMLLDKVEIKSIRGDYDSAFVSPFLTNFLALKNIRYFFTPQVFTNRNRVVDRVIRTIRNMFYNLGPNVSLFDNDLMQKVVHAYNNKIHKGLFNSFTPNQAQHNSMIEHTYIIEKNMELDRVNHSLMEQYQYQPGDILLCHIPAKETIKVKRRKNFNTLTYFIKYLHGNVFIEIYSSGIQISVPMYCTKFLAKSIDMLSEEAKRTFLK
jgi:hypothetical protein